MKVIMVRDVGGVGRRDTIVEVSDGYALNYLIPKGMAVQATDAAQKAHEEHAARASAQAVREGAEIAARVRALEGARIVIRARANDKGHLFKGVGAKDIVREEPLHSAGIGQEMLILPHLVLKETGTFEIEIAAAGARAKAALVIEKA